MWGNPQVSCYKNSKNIRNDAKALKYLDKGTGNRYNSTYRQKIGHALICEYAALIIIRMNVILVQ